MTSEQSHKVSLIQVYARLKPYTDAEKGARKKTVIKNCNHKQLVLQSGPAVKEYEFDRVFGKDATQTDVYGVVVEPLIDSVLSGYTCTVFAYGQTGTGKTYTMIGDGVTASVDLVEDASVGMVPRAAADIFNKLEASGKEYSVSVSCVEIYNEEVRDLLISDSPPLKVYDDPEVRGATNIMGLTEVTVQNCDELFTMLMVGTNERHTAATNLNRQSSRSHTIFTICVTVRELGSSEEIIKTGKLHLIDLAGSENVRRSGATDQRAREAGNINKSLLTLGKVIKALATKAGHVPYRESKLTRILQDSLGGKSKTCIIATFSPFANAYDETVSTLDYAYEARSVANCPTVNVNVKATNVIKETQEEVAYLRQELNAARAGEGFFMASESYDSILLDIKTKYERITTLAKQIAKMEDDIKIKRDKLNELDQYCKLTNVTVEDYTNKLQEVNSMYQKHEADIKDMKNNTAQLKNEMRMLLDVCQTSTKHAQIFYQKYGNQCAVSVHNANLAQDMCSKTKDCFNHVENITENLFTHVKKRLTDATKKVELLKESYLTDVDKLNEIAHDAQEYVNSANCTFNTYFDDPLFTEDAFANWMMSASDKNFTLLKDGVTVMKENLLSLWRYINFIESNIKSLTPQYIEEIHNLVKEVKRNYDQYYLKLESVLENKRKRLFTVKRLIENAEQSLVELERLQKLSRSKHEDLTKEYKFLMKVESEILQAIEELAKGAKESWENLHQLAENLSLEPYLFDELENLLASTSETITATRQSYCDEMSKNHEEAMVYGLAFGNALEHKFNTYNEKFNKMVESWLQNGPEMQDNQCRVTTECCGNILKAVSSASNAQKKFETDLNCFVEESVECIESMAKDVDRRIHAGDTPVKTSYDFRQKITATLSSEVLKNEANKSLKEFGDNN